MEVAADELLLIVKAGMVEVSNSTRRERLEGSRMTGGFTFEAKNTRISSTWLIMLVHFAIKVDCSDGPATAGTIHMAR